MALNSEIRSHLGSTYASEQIVEAINVKNANRLSAHFVYADATPAADTFTAADTDICTAEAHGMVTGLKVQLTTTDTLPAGLSLLTDYYVINLSADTFSLASSLNNALAGTAVDITDAGTGTHTITAVEVSTATMAIQVSNDNENWIDVGTPTDITSDGDVIVEDDVYYAFARVKLAIASGQFTVSSAMCIKFEI